MKFRGLDNMAFAISRKPTPLDPKGRACGYGSIFETREEAQKVLDLKRAEGWLWAYDMHVIETSGDINSIVTVAQW